MDRLGEDLRGRFGSYGVHAVADIDDLQSEDRTHVSYRLLDGSPASRRLAVELDGAMADAGIGTTGLVERFESVVVEQVTPVGNQHEVMDGVAFR